jgi:nitric oxide reductase NorE protein
VREEAKEDSVQSTVDAHVPAKMEKAGGAVKKHIPGEPGVWLFLLGDMVIFGLFFIVFLYHRGQDVALYLESQKILDQNLGIINTLLLLTSSWFVVTGVRTARKDIPCEGIWFALAFFCGLGFVINKFFEYKAKLRAGITLFTNDFYMYYYIFTGIHLWHVILGLGVLAFMWRLTRLKSPSSRHIAFLEGGASFWHLVDVIWIILFPLLYLLR